MATKLIEGTWSTDSIRGWCLQLYPSFMLFQSSWPKP